MNDRQMDQIEERLRAALAEKYSVEQKLGEGGMAFVYLARDLKHDRMVAIKVLKPDLAASIGAERFLNEIRHTAKLSHPHILPLYDSGEADGILFYVMPFVEGESLNDFVKREKQLSITEAVKITREVAEALSHAHSYGLIHRDIKPDNIMMSGGHAIVADFGISKALSDAGGEQLTQTGTSVGTPAYMSPEQAMGSPDIDGRSDIYSLGCVLYQMLVGDIPFTGPTPQAIMARHTMDQLTPPSIMRDTVPPDLEDIIYTAMAKTPADRFRTAHEFVEALQAFERGSVPGVRASAIHQRMSTQQRMSAAQRMSGMQTMPTPQTPVPSVAALQPAWRRAVLPAGVALGVLALGIAGWQLLGNRGSSGGSGAPEGGLDPRQVAVLYFDDLSSGDTLGFVTDGLTEGLIDKLSAVQGLGVVSRNGVAPYRGSDVPRDSIARLLEVGSLIAGSIEPVGDRLRVTARLVDGASGADIDRASFELSARDLLAAEDSVIESVSRFLRQRLGEEIRVRERRGETASVEAWGYVQRAERLRKDAERLTDQADTSGAVRLLQQADSILASAEAADRNWVEPSILRGWITYDRSRLARGLEGAPLLEQALASANRALEREARNPEALALRGTVRYRQFQLEVTPDPTELDSLLFGAKADLETAVETDPGLADAHITLSRLYYEPGIRDVPSALLAARRGYEADAYLDRADALLNRLFWGHIDLEQFSQARRWCAEGARRFPTQPAFLSCQLWLMATPAVPADVDEAWGLLAWFDSLTPGTGPTFNGLENLMLVGGALGRAGLVDSARSVLLRARNAATSEIDPHQDLVPVEAYVRSLFGDHDEAIDLLKAYVAANPEHNFPAQAGTAWWWRELRGHPRFVEITGG